MGGYLSGANEDEEPAEGPDALDAADDKTEPIVFEEEKGLTNDGRTYAEVVREGPEKSEWKFVPAAPADVVVVP